MKPSWKSAAVALLLGALVNGALAQEHQGHEQMQSAQSPTDTAQKKPSVAKPKARQKQRPGPQEAPMHQHGEPQQAPPPSEHQGHEMAPTEGQPQMNMPDMPGMEGMQGMQGMQHKSLEELLKADPSNLVPKVGAKRTGPVGPVMRLEELEQIALSKNPTLAQASSEIKSAQGRTLQAGLYPNPTIGYSGEEIRGGASRGGQQGFFVQQDIVMGGKLGLSRNVARQEIRLAEIEAEEQRIRVQNAVRLAFYQTLASQEMLELDRSFVELSRQMVATAQRLLNIGARDRSEVLQTEISLQKAELALKRQENQHRQIWRALTAVVGDPSLPMATLEGDLEQMADESDQEGLTQLLLTQSPAVRISQASVDRAVALLALARREPVPDLQFRGGLQQNLELRSPGLSVGLQGFAELGIRIPIFNRNQGNVLSARADLERAHQEQTRIQLVLRERAAAIVRAFEDAQDTVHTYQKKIIPRSQELYEMQLKAWGQMAVSYPVVLQAQNNLFDVQSEYVLALRDLQAASIVLRGFLLTDGLEAPARPGEVAMPVREVNVPVSRGGMER